MLHRLGPPGALPVKPGGAISASSLWVSSARLSRSIVEAKPTYSEADYNKLERNAEITLSGDGTIQGKIHQESFGQSAALERGRFRVLSADRILALAAAQRRASRPPHG